MACMWACMSMMTVARNESHFMEVGAAVESVDADRDAGKVHSRKIAFSEQARRLIDFTRDLRHVSEGKH